MPPGLGRRYSTRGASHRMVGQPVIATSPFGKGAGSVDYSHQSRRQWRDPGGKRLQQPQGVSRRRKHRPIKKFPVHPANCGRKTKGTHLGRIYFSGKTAGLGGPTARAYGGLQSQTHDDAVQPGLTPVKRPRCTHNRTAANSLSLWGSSTHCSQFSGIASGQAASRRSAASPPANRQAKLPHGHKAA
jgi:hypothetical protein